MKIVPKETRLIEMDASDVAKLLQSAGAPAGTKRFKYGKAEVLSVPPEGTRGWWVSVYRPDRPITQDELIKIVSSIIPPHIRVDGRIEPKPSADGNYHAVAYEMVKKNGDPPYQS